MAHPLDPLSADEFASAAEILRRDRGVEPGVPGGRPGRGWRFASIEMIEPTKAEITAADSGGAWPPRRAEVICFDRDENATYRGVVSLSEGRVEVFEHIPGVQANFTVDEFTECDELLRTHPDVVAALRRRGIENVDLVFFDTWTYGDAVAPAEFRDRRIGWSDSWVKAAPGANPYARLVSGLHCVVDLNAMELIALEDEGPFADGQLRRKISVNF